MIPTAEEFLKEQKIGNNTIYNYEGEDVGYISNAMIEFAKLHCEEQAKVISEKALMDRKPTGEGESSEEYKGVSFEGDLGYEDYIPVEYTIDKDSILNAYDLNNIK